MKNNYCDDFIFSSEDILDENQIKFLFNCIGHQSSVKFTDQKYTPNGQWPNGEWMKRKNMYRDDYQFPLDPYWPKLCNDINKNLYNKLLIPYINKYTTALYRDRTVEYINGTIILQKTEPGGGYHQWHDENCNWTFRNRMFAWMIYLNDIEHGGETEFLYQKTRFKPKRNVGFIWPGGFTHTHRGNPPLSETKYILTGWIVPVNGDLIDVNMNS